MRIIIRFLLLTIFLIGWIPEGEASEIPRARFIAAQPMVFNPSNGEETVILFTIFKEAQVTVRIYDSLDRLVRTLCMKKGR
jgi:hypothetical protein